MMPTDPWSWPRAAKAARFCAEHSRPLFDDTLICPVGHELGEDAFVVREYRGKPQSYAPAKALVWIAALFDQFGSIRKGKVFSVAINCKDAGKAEAIRTFSSLGTICQSNAGYSVVGANAVKFLRAIQPYVRVKASAVSEALAAH